MAPQTRCGAASIVSSSTIADIVVPFCFYVAVRLYLTYRLSIEEKGNFVKGVPRLSTLLLCLLSPLWSESANRASEVEMGGGENRCERIEHGWPTTFNQRTHCSCAQTFMGQHDFRDRTVVEKVQCDDGFPALRSSAGQGIDQFFGWNNLQVGADHATAVL